MILCCGEALIDMLPRQTAAGAACFQPCPGGAVFNTAIALGRQGVPTGLFTGLSRDLFGDLLARHLAESHVDTTLAVRSDRPTTLAFVELRGGQARYSFYDENTAGRMLSSSDLPDLPGTVTALFFGGISLMVEPAGSAYEALLARAAETGVPVMVDPNIRPGFIADEAAYRARLDRVIGAARIVKVSDEDLRWIFGPGETGALAGRLRAQGPDLVCVTEGAEGARAYFAEGNLHVPAARVDVADTVGAGDTFNGGLLAALHAAGVLSRAGLATLDAATVRAALERAIAAAAVTVSREGANPPWRHELS